MAHSPTLAVMDWLKSPVSVDVGDESPVPLEDCAELVPSEALRDALKACGFSSLFPVQTVLLKNFQSFDNKDYGVVAPTGSGKTLAYTIPILNEVIGRKIVRLRALIIVPTRVLVLQAHKLLTSLVDAVPGCTLKIGCATGKSALAREQSAIFDSSEGRSRVDILVCTPGRLVEHLRFTPGFSLQDLRFLVVDEADRLLEQAYQDWLLLVRESTKMDERRAMPFGGPLEDIRWRRYGQLKKIILSASLLDKPAELMQLRLNDPVLVNVTSFSGSSPLPASILPSTISHHFIAMPASKKPLAVLYLLRHLHINRCLVFAGSSQTTARLARFLQRADVACAFVTRETDTNVVRSILADFSSHRCNVLVASDCLSRGLDLPDVAAVINYDCPFTPALYAHRAGRSGRAGNVGACYTVLASSEVNYFKGAMGVAAKRIRPEVSVLQDLAPIAQSALGR